MKNEKIGFKSLQYGVVAGLTLMAFGCSDGGNYNQGSDSSIVVDGTVAQGKIKNAKVCADMNFNDRCDAGEPFTFTQATSAFAGRYLIRNIPANTPYQFITEGGIDSLTGKQAFALRALSGVRNITPITTLVAQSADPAAMITLLDNLSGGQGYDIDISSDSMPVEFLSLVKSTELLLDTLAQSGLSSAEDQAVILRDIATELAAQPLTTAGNSLGTIFAAAATRIAERPATDFNADFVVTDSAAFASAIETMANDIETIITANSNPDGSVNETQDLQTNLEDNLTPPVLPVTAVTMFASRISILNSAATVQDSALLAVDQELAVSAGSFATAKVLVSGTSTEAKTYPAASFTLNVSDTESNRSLQVVVSGINVAVDATGVVTISGGNAIALRGVNADGAMVLEKSLSTLGTLVSFEGNAVLLNIQAIQDEVNPAAADMVVNALGSYSVTATISGAPGVPAAVGLTVN